MSASLQTPRLIAVGAARNISGYDRAEYDWYVEGPEIVDALLDIEAHFGGFPGPVWDPACGGGNIPQRCKARGIRAKGSDIVNRGYGEAGVDFLACRIRRVGSIITNPPFGRSLKPWAFKALACAKGKVALLAPWSWYESVGRDDLLGCGLHYPTPLARVWVSRKRVSMPPGGLGVKPKGGKVPYAWYVFEHGHQGAPALGRI